MGILRLTYAEKQYEGSPEYFILTSQLRRFDSSLLDLGDVSKEGKYFESLAAVFDLEGFTSFCNQIDPHLVIPEYLNQFLNWLFQSISKEFTRGQDGDETVLWCPLPFFAKFVGDGVLFLWDTRKVYPIDIGNIVLSLNNICDEYNSTFLSAVRKSITKPPQKLRCGIARGQIISIGDGKDFVGSCINVASRLQKIGQFSFAFPRRGFDLVKHFTDEAKEEYVLIRMAIRGIGDEELLYVQKNEFELLTDLEKKQLIP